MSSQAQLTEARALVLRAVSMFRMRCNDGYIRDITEDELQRLAQICQTALAEVCKAKDRDFDDKAKAALVVQSSSVAKQLQRRWGDTSSEEGGAIVEHGRAAAQAHDEAQAAEVVSEAKSALRLACDMQVAEHIGGMQAIRIRWSELAKLGGASCTLRPLDLDSASTKKAFRTGAYAGVSNKTRSAPRRVLMSMYQFRQLLRDGPQPPAQDALEEWTKAGLLCDVAAYMGFVNQGAVHHITNSGKDVRRMVPERTPADPMCVIKLVEVHLEWKERAELYQIGGYCPPNLASRPLATRIECMKEFRTRLVELMKAEKACQLSAAASDAWRAWRFPRIDNFPKNVDQMPVVAYITLGTRNKDGNSHGKRPRA
jgi:hypothetical protein